MRKGRQGMIMEGRVEGRTEGTMFFLNYEYKIHIFELRNEEINVKKILAVINATYAVANLRNPEKLKKLEN